jgi:hypothetical protein
MCAVPWIHALFVIFGHFFSTTVFISFPALNVGHSPVTGVLVCYATRLRATREVLVQLVA